MNIFQIQEQLRGIPDDGLIKEMQNPSGVAPQFLVMTELQRRKELRVGSSQPAPSSTVMDDLAAETMQGAQGPQQAQQPQMPQPGMQQAAQQPMQQAAQQGMQQGMPGYAEGGMVQAQAQAQPQQPSLMAPQQMAPPPIDRRDYNSDGHTSWLEKSGLMGLGGPLLQLITGGGKNLEQFSPLAMLMGCPA